MVCSRCKMVVENEIKKAGLHPISVELGEVEIEEALNKTRKNELNSILGSFGFTLIDDKRSRLIEKIKSTILSVVRSNEKSKIKLSQHIARALMMTTYSILWQGQDWKPMGRTEKRCLPIPDGKLKPCGIWDTMICTAMKQS
ncbi:hypothetical protein BH11BAC1_BH11BAC1_20170 [soil metagenome]